MTASTPMRCGRSARSVFCTVRDLATKRLPESIPSLLVSTVTAALVTVCGAFLVGPMGGWTPGVDASRSGCWRLAAVLLLVGYQFIIMAMRTGEISFVAPFRYTALLWAILLGFLVFGDVPDGPMIAGAVIVVGSGLYTLYRERVVGRGTPAAASTTPGHGARRALDDADEQPAISTSSGRRAGRRALLAHGRRRQEPAAARRAAAARACARPAARQASRPHRDQRQWRSRTLRRVRPAGARRHGSPAISARWPGCSPACNGRKASAQPISSACRPTRRSFRDDLGAAPGAKPRRADAPGAGRLGRPAPSGVGLWPVALAGRLADFLRSGATYKVSAFADDCDARRRRFPDDRARRPQPRSVLQRQHARTTSPLPRRCSRSCGDEHASSASPAGRTPARRR